MTAGLSILATSQGVAAALESLRASSDHPSGALTQADVQFRGEANFANKLLSAMRYEFGGHLEKPAGKSKAA